MREKIIKTKSPAETKNFAFKLGKSLKGGKIICLYGNLGSGKTTFVQGLAQGLGITKRILSPTFIIVRSYKLKDRNFYHVDLYRTSLIDDLRGIGLEEILLDNESIVAIEWAEKLGSMLSKKRIEIKLENLEGDERKIEIKEYE